MCALRFVVSNGENLLKSDFSQLFNVIILYQSWVSEESRYRNTGIKLKNLEKSWDSMRKRG